MADFSSGFVGGGLTDARQKYQALNIQRRNAATAEGTLNQNIISSDRNFALEQEKFGELKRSTGVAETAAREAQTRADIERDKKEMESMQVAVTQANEQIRLLYSQTPTADRQLIQSKVDALRAVVSNIIEVGMKIKPAQAQSWQLRHNKILETPFGANRTAELTGQAISAGVAAQAKSLHDGLLAKGFVVPIEDILEGLGATKRSTVNSSLAHAGSDILDVDGRVNPSTTNALYKLTAPFVGGFWDEAAQQMRGLDDASASKMINLMATASELLASQLELSPASAMQEAARQQGYPVGGEAEAPGGGGFAVGQQVDFTTAKGGTQTGTVISVNSDGSARVRTSTGGEVTIPPGQNISGQQ